MSRHSEHNSCTAHRTWAHPDIPLQARYAGQRQKRRLLLQQLSSCELTDVTGMTHSMCASYQTVPITSCGHATPKTSFVTPVTHIDFFETQVPSTNVRLFEVTTCTLIVVNHHHHPRCYNPCRVLTDSIISLHPSLSMVLVLQFLIPSLSASLFTPSIHLRFGLPTLLQPSGIPRVIFLHGRLSCIRTMCPAHLNLVFLIAVTRSISPYKWYSSSLYLELQVSSSQMGP